MWDGLDLAFAATLEPAAAIAYLRAKGLGVSWDWHDTWEAAHARALPPAPTATAAEEQIRRAIAGRAGRLVRLDDGSGTTAFALVPTHRDATVGWTFFRPSRIDSRRRGYLLYRR